MNGARSTFMRKGYWFTALAAAGLLAASPGTTLAQGTLGIKSVKVDAANSAGAVAEGITTSVTVTLTGKVTGNDPATVTVTHGATADASSTLGVNDSGELTNGKGNAEYSDEVNPKDLLLASPTVSINVGQDSGTITLLVNDDLDAVDEAYAIRAELMVLGDITGDTDARTASTTGKIIDDETQTYTFKLTTPDDEVLEDSTFNVTLSAKPILPAQEHVPVFLRAPKGYTVMYVNTAAADVPIPGMGLILGDGDEDNPGEASYVLRVKAPGNDENRTDDDIMLTALTGTVASNNPVGTSDSLTVLDIHQLPTDITGEANGADADGKETDAVVTMVEEGGKAFLYVTVVNEDGDDDRVFDEEDFTVTPSLSGSQVLDARIMPTNMKVFDGEEGRDGEMVVGPFTLEAVPDEDIGMETLMVSLDVTGGKDPSGKAYGSGTSSGTFSINVTDTTAPLVSVKDDAYEAIMMAVGDAVAPGSVVMIMTDDLFDKAEGYTASFGASVEGDSISASASGDRITLTASSDMTGESKVTVTATARMASPSFIPSQTVSNVAEITFPVMVIEAEPVVPEPVPALPLIAQWLLGLGLMGGGARQLFRRRSQSQG